MAEVNRLEFTYKEVVTALIKQQDLREGIWAVSVKFGIAGIIGGPTPEQSVPTAMVPVLSIGLSRADKESSIAVDAAKVYSSEKLKPKQKSPAGIISRPKS